MNHLIHPAYETLNHYDYFPADLHIEYQQALEEGKDIAAYEALFQTIRQMPHGEYQNRMADVLYDLMMSLPQREDYAYEEPSDLEGIRAARPAPVFQPCTADESTLADHIRGAWYARVCGCLLGKTVEGIRTDELHPLLKESGNWPMHRYIRSTDPTEEMFNTFRYKLRERCFADNIPCAPADDDTNYMVLAQLIVEKYGRDFTPENVGQAWMDLQPREAYCTAERIAFNNLVCGFRPPYTAVWHNHYREWIGAQIRGDYFGYINPGQPEKAAEMAWRDASISHIKNGIYGEMFISAIIAAAAVEQDIEKLIYAGLEQIPEKCRLSEAVLHVLDEYKNGVSQEDCAADIHSTWDEHSAHGWCHTISNAMIVVMALLYGQGDFGKSICLAVQTGFDTDCNGATVGSILGMRSGMSIIGEEWTAPIRGQLDTSIFGVGRVQLEDMVQKTLTHVR